MGQTTGATGPTTIDHRSGLSFLAVATAMGTPAIIIWIGIANFGIKAVDWSNIVFWGLAATLLYTLWVEIFRRAGATLFNPVFVLGSFAGDLGSRRAKIVGWAAHLAVGALLAISGAYSTSLFYTELNWFTGIVWGLFVSLMALVLISSIGAFHPAVRKKRLIDPGSMGLNHGKATPYIILTGHLIFGFVLGYGHAL